MQALSFDYASFGIYLNQPASKFTIDLSQSNVKEVLTEYSRFKRMQNPGYNLSYVIYQIELLERDYNITLEPIQITDVFWSMWFARLSNIGLLPSSIKNYFDILRAALTWGTRHNLRVSPTYDNYNIDRYTRCHPALSPDEVSLIAHFDIRKNLVLAMDQYRKKAMKWVEDYSAKHDEKWIIRMYKAIESLKRDSKYHDRVTQIKTKYESKLISLKKKNELYERKLKGYSASALINREKLIETLERVRDQFVIQCNLGQRYSDIVRLCPACFSEDKSTYKIVQQKTGNKAVVDISKFAFDKKVLYRILEKYGYTAPYRHSINNFNSYLHILLKMIGGPFCDTIKSENKVRGEIITEEVPKYAAIASHTARRSFATINIQRGYPEVVVRHATGHLDSRSFQRYIIFEE